MAAPRPTIDDVLLVVARALLRFCRPKTAHVAMMRVGRWLPSLDGADDALAAMRSLGRRGTCLGRALAIAARTPGADVVIAVAPRGGDALFAHAWLEIGDVPLDPQEVAGTPIARLRRCDTD